jgi:AraC-like DNA-binding protein
MNIREMTVYHALSIVKFLTWFGYIVAQSLCIINFERRRKPSSFQQNLRLVNWIKGFNITLIILFFVLLIQRGFQNSFISVDLANDITISFTLLVIISFLITKLHLLYSVGYSEVSLVSGGPEPTVANDLSNQNQVHNGLVKSLYSAKKKNEYLDMLNKALVRDKPFLIKGITVKELSEHTGIPAHHLSYLINVEFNLHFQDFINLKRIEYLKSKIDDLEWKQLTLEGICWEIGFTSRTTFFRAFVKLTGISPSEYFRNARKNNTA